MTLDQDRESFYTPHHVPPLPCRAEEANKSFSAAVQLHDNLVKAWALWGDFLDILFDQDHNLTLGASALTCFLHACRNQSEGRCRKYIARIFWILSFDDDKGTLAEIVDKYYGGISPMHWLPWIPQLLTCLVRKEGGHMLNLLCSLGKAYPQALYFPIRALYLSLKMEQRGKRKLAIDVKIGVMVSCAIDFSAQNLSFHQCFGCV